MERTKKAKQQVLYQKIGGGSLHLPNRIIKPNQKFRAYPEEIPTAFKDLVVVVNKDEAEAAERVEEDPKLEYFLKDKGGGWYDIVNSSGKVQNEKSLRKEEAEKFLLSMQ